MHQQARPARKWGALQWAITLGVVLLWGFASVATFRSITTAGEKASAVKNLRAVGGMLHAWASENGGIFPDALHYPEGKTANRVFRQLFIDGICQDEQTFSAPRSPFKPDGKIGSKPAFEDAVGANENHWMMFDGLSNSTAANEILVFENSVNAAWPPFWQKDEEEPKRGRAWQGGWVAVCQNDLSVMFVKLELRGGRLVLPNSLLISNPRHPTPPPTVLDIETR